MAIGHNGSATRGMRILYVRGLNLSRTEQAKSTESASSATAFNLERLLKIQGKESLEAALMVL